MPTNNSDITNGLWEAPRQPDAIMQDHMIDTNQEQQSNFDWTVVPFSDTLHFCHGYQPLPACVDTLPGLDLGSTMVVCQAMGYQYPLDGTNLVDSIKLDNGQTSHHGINSLLFITALYTAWDGTQLKYVEPSKKKKKRPQAIKAAPSLRPANHVKPPSVMWLLDQVNWLSLGKKLDNGPL